MIMKPKTMEELVGGELCDYCPTTFGHSPTTLCEGCCCDEAYQNYLDKQEAE
jgi:hypothetical protein